jgi:integrase
VGEIIRRTKDGKFLGFYLRFYEGGRRRILASKQASHAEARRMLIEIEARVARGEAGIPERPTERITVAELIERFLSENGNSKLKDLAKYRAISRSVLKRVVSELGKRDAAELTQRDIGRLRDRLSKELAPGSVGAVLIRLGAAYTWALREGLVSTNPCRGVAHPRAPQSLDFFSREEVQKMLTGAAARAQASIAGWMLHVGIALAVHTGLRKGELFGLRWTDLDLDAMRLSIMRSYRTTPKGGKARHLRLPSHLVPLLRAWQERCPPSPENLVIPIGKGSSRIASDSSVMLGLPGLMRELGLREVMHPWHLLRHTFASHFVMSGGNILALQKILGHSDVKMTMVYAHLAPDFLGQEMERVRF